MKKYVGLLVFLLATIPSFSQDENIFSYDAFIELVSEHHPVAYQTRLLKDLIDANSQMARGHFDPKIESDFDRKRFKKTNYYTNFNGNLKVPTWFGAELKAGYEQSTGTFTDNSDFLPPRGLWNAGLTMTLGQGLIIDERRAALKRADIFARATEQDRRLMLNDLIYDAGLAYLQWQIDFRRLAIAQQGIDLATARFEGTKGSFENGDKPAIDTLESFISLQNRQQSYTVIQQEYELSKIELQNYLWADGAVPMELQEDVVPEIIERIQFKHELDSIRLFQANILAQHPELLTYDFKVDNLELDNRLNREALKPVFDVSYSPLIATTDESLFVSPNFNDYKLGARFSFPLFLRKERAKVEMTNLKIKDTQFVRTEKQQLLLTKLNQYYNNNLLLDTQLDNLIAITENYNRLLSAENQKFQLGESSIFLVNSRETKFLESQFKVIETNLKLVKNRLGYLFSAGQLWNN